MSGINQSNSIIANKSYAFALEIVLVYKELSSEKKEFVLSKQLLRSGTSVGANVNEALGSESKRDFVHKLSIALKEAKETSYWLNLLKDSGYIAEERFNKLHGNCNEIIKIINSIILTIKQKYFTKPQNS